MEASSLIREARRRAGLSQKELARRVQTSQSVIARWEAGGRDPGFATLQRVAKACGLDVSVGLEPHDDHDLNLARQTDSLSPGERIQYMLDWTRKIEELVINAKRVS